MKTSKITLDTIKDEGWGDVVQELELSDEKADQYFEYCEYASIEIEIDENLNIIGGRVLKL